MSSTADSSRHGRTIHQYRIISPAADCLAAVVVRTGPTNPLALLSAIAMLATAIDRPTRRYILLSVYPAPNQ